MPIDYFRNVKETITFKAGDTIIQEDQPGDLMYAVQSGSVEIRYKGELLEIVEAGGFFGEMALIDNAPRAASAIAKTDCQLAIVDKKQFLFLVHETPTFAIDVMSTMADRIRRLSQ